MDSQDTTLQVMRSTAYGTTRYKPLNSLADRFAALLEQASFSVIDVERIKALGYEVLLVPDISSEPVKL